MQIKTLAEILAESDTDSASAVSSTKKRDSSNNDNNNKLSKAELFNRRKSKKAKYLTPNDDDSYLHEDAENKTYIAENDLSDESLFNSVQPPPKKKSKKQKRFHPASTFIAEPNNAPVYKAPEEQTIKEMLAEVKQSYRASQADDVFDTEKSIKDVDGESLSQTKSNSANTDNLPSALKAYLRTPEQKQAELDVIKAESRLRWLAFYYLSRREYGRAELKQKLVDKEQDPNSINALLDEFEEKGYQSDYRTTLMIIRESIRKGRGHDRIKQEFYKKKIAMPSNIDELIDMANTESEEFSEFVDVDEDSLVDGVDWLKLAVAARTRKYGDSVPVEQKEKARQLRFLQYRGFKADVCFEALNYTLDNLDERF